MEKNLNFSSLPMGTFVRLTGGEILMIVHSELKADENNDFFVEYIAMETGNTTTKKKLGIVLIEDIEECLHYGYEVNKKDFFDNKVEEVFDNEGMKILS